MFLCAMSPEQHEQMVGHMASELRLANVVVGIEMTEEQAHIAATYLTEVWGWAR